MPRTMSPDGSVVTPVRYRRGFTLIESIVTLTLIAIITGITAREVVSYLNQRRAIVAARKVQWEISVARSFAVRLGRPVTSRLDEATRVLSVTDSAGTVLRSVSFGRTSDMPVNTLTLDIVGDSLRFSERGLCLNCPVNSSATFAINAAGRTRYVRVGLLGRGEVTSK